MVTYRSVHSPVSKRKISTHPQEQVSTTATPLSYLTIHTILWSGWRVDTPHYWKMRRGRRSACRGWLGTGRVVSPRLLPEVVLGDGCACPCRASLMALLSSVSTIQTSEPLITQSKQRRHGQNVRNTLLTHPHRPTDMDTPG